MMRAMKIFSSVHGWCSGESSCCKAQENFLCYITAANNKEQNLTAEKTEKMEKNDSVISIAEF